MITEEKKVLILYVDRDADVSKITNTKTPIIGKEEALKVAIKFATLSPEDSDTNALFYSLKLYDELISKKVFKECEIAIVAGDESEGILADNKIRFELLEVLKKYKADGVIMISDGGRDELVIPVISSIIPIISIKRVIVGQSKGVEEFYMVLYKYIKKISQDPSLSKFFIGFPGLLLVIYGILALFGYAYIFSLLFLIFIGSYILIKGFYLDKKIIGVWNNSKIQLISFIIGFLIGIVSIINGLGYVQKLNPSTPLHQLIGEFFITNFSYGLNTLNVLSLSVVVFLIGRIIEKIINNHYIKTEIILIVFTLSLGIIGTYISFLIARPISSDVIITSYLPTIFIIFLLNIIVILSFAVYEKYIKS